MKNENTLTPRETLFCSLYAGLGNPAEAARRAGYRKPGRVAARLLGRREIQDETARQLESRGRRAAALALAGLERVAFGGIGDAVALLDRGEGLRREDLAELDLFSVAELKSPRGGGVEMKFFDRIKALELLLGHAKDSGGEKAHSFYSALEKSARALSGSDSDCDGV